MHSPSLKSFSMILLLAPYLCIAQDDSDISDFDTSPAEQYIAEGGSGVDPFAAPQDQTPALSPSISQWYSGNDVSLTAEIASLETEPAFLSFSAALETEAAFQSPFSQHLETATKGDVMILSSSAGFPGGVIAGFLTTETPSSGATSAAATAVDTDSDLQPTSSAAGASFTASNSVGGQPPSTAEISSQTQSATTAAFTGGVASQPTGSILGVGGALVGVLGFAANI